MSSLLYGPGSETLAVVVLNSQELGRIGPTAALSVLLALLVAVPALAAVGRRCERRARRDRRRDSSPRWPVSAEPVLEVTDLVVAYDGTTALRGVTWRRPRRGAGAARPVRVGQVDAAARGGGLPGAEGRTVRLAGRTVVGDGRPVPPERRDLAVVFQNYALWPHLSAAGHRGLSRCAVAAPAAPQAPRRGAGPAAAAGHRPPRRPAAGRALRRRAAAGRPGPCAGPASVAVPVRRADRPPRHPRPRPSSSRSWWPGSATAARPPSTPRTTPRRRSASPTGSPCCATGELLQVGTPRQVYDEPVDLFAARLTGPASVIDAPDGSGRLLVRPGWARLGGPLEGRLRAVWFRGPALRPPRGDRRWARCSSANPARRGTPVGACTGWTLVHGWPIAALTVSRAARARASGSRGR